MTLPGQWGKELVFAQCHPPTFKKALLIGLREALQLGRRDPRSHIDELLSKQEFPDALEEISLHLRLEPQHERLQADGRPPRPRPRRATRWCGGTRPSLPSDSRNPSRTQEEPTARSGRCPGPRHSAGPLQRATPRAQGKSPADRPTTV